MRVHLGLEQPLRQIHGVGSRDPAGFKVQLLQPAQQAAHTAVGVVDVFEALFDSVQTIFGQSDGALRLPGLEQIL